MLDSLKTRIERLERDFKNMLKQSVRSEITGAIGRTTFGDLPPAGQAGRLYFVTDTGNIFYDDGTQWVAITATVIPAPGDAKYILQQPYSGLPNAQALSALSTGLLKSNTGSGELTIAIRNIDYANPENTIYVSTIFDLPPVVGGKITLPDNYVYIFKPGELITLSNELVIGNGTIIHDALISTSQKITFSRSGIIDNSTIVYTGTGTIFEAANTSPAAFIKFEFVTISATNATFFDLDTTQMSYLLLTDIAFVGNGNTFGSITGGWINKFYGLDCSFLGAISGGLTINDATATTITSFFLPNGGSGSFTILTFNGTSQESIQLSEIVLNNSAAGIYAYKFDTSTTFNAAVRVYAGQVYDKTKVFAPSSYTQKTLNFNFFEVGNVEDSTVSGEAESGENTTTFTIIPATNALVMVNTGLSYISDNLERTSVDGNGIVKYLGLEPTTLSGYGKINCEPQAAFQLVRLRFFRIYAEKRTVTFDNITDVVNETATPRANGDIVSFYQTAGTLPTGLRSDILYYVVNKTANTFQLSYTMGGAVVTFTTNGTGTNSYSVVELHGATGRDEVGVGAPTDIDTSAILLVDTGDSFGYVIWNATGTTNILVRFASHGWRK